MTSPLTVTRAAETLLRFLDRYGDAPLVLRRRTLAGSVGGYPTIPITALALGGDWNAGKIFAFTEVPICAVGEEFEKERAETRKLNEKLGWMYYVINGPLSDQEKIKALKRMMKE